MEKMMIWSIRINSADHHKFHWQEIQHQISKAICNADR